MYCPMSMWYCTIFSILQDIFKFSTAGLFSLLAPSSNRSCELNYLIVVNWKKLFQNVGSWNITLKWNKISHQNLLGNSYPKYCHMRDLGCISWLYIFFLLFLASDLEIYKKKAKNKKCFPSWKFSSISIEKKEEAQHRWTLK